MAYNQNTPWDSVLKRFWTVTEMLLLVILMAPKQSDLWLSEKETYRCMQVPTIMAGQPTPM